MHRPSPLHRISAAFTAALVYLLTPISGVNAATIFFEDFEPPPDVTAAQSSGNTSGAIPAGWVGATAGFGANRRGIIDVASGFFSDSSDPANTQAFAFRYTNSGLTTDRGTLGTILPDYTYTVTFNHGMDAGRNNGTPYRAALFAETGQLTLNDVRGGPEGTDISHGAAKLIQVTGNAAADIDISHGTKVFSWDSSAADAGKNLILRFYGATTSANIDNVVIEAVEIPPFQWDTNGSLAGAGGPIPNGIWDGATANWNKNADGMGTTESYVAGRTAVFSAGTDATGSYTVTVSGQQDIGSLVFEDGNATITGDALRLVKNSSIDVGSGLTATIASNIDEDSNRSITKLGGGTLVLSGNTTHDGGTVVNEGTLRLGADNILRDNRAVTLAGNAPGVVAVLDLAGHTDRIGMLTVGGASPTSGGAVNFGGGTLEFDGVSYGGANNPLGINLTGPVVIHGGAYNFSIGSSASASPEVTLSGPVSGSSGIFKTGNGILALTNAASTFSGRVYPRQGILRVTTLADIGAPSSIGTGNGDPEIVLGGGSGFSYEAVLQNVGPGGSTNRPLGVMPYILNNGNNVPFVLDSSGSGPIAFTNAAPIDWHGTDDSRYMDVSRTLRLRGTNTDANTLASDLADNGTGALSVEKTGPGKWILDGANTYTGPTSVNEGTLLVNGSLGSSPVTVVGGATFGGTGSSGGPVAISGGVHAPGASAGIQTFSGGLTYNSATSLQWELTDNTDTGRGLSFDGVDVLSGLLSIDVGSVSELIFDSSGSGVDWSDSFWWTDHSWLVFDNENAPSLTSPDIFDGITMSADSLSQPFPGASLGTFEWAQDGNDILLNFTGTGAGAGPVVPEPSTMALLGMALAALLVQGRRRRRG